MGRKRRTGTAQIVGPTQREILRDVMLAAGKYGAWMTLHELARLTRYGETSISAQLRHLRKVKCGGGGLEKSVGKPEGGRRKEHFVVWEYRLPAKRLPTGRRISARRSMAARPRRIQ